MIGLGHVGGTLARGLAAAGATLVVADVAAGRRALADELGAAWVEPGRGAARRRRHRRARARSAACSTTTRCPRCAAARSPARRTTSSPPTTSPSELHARGILWAPDFVANAGGIINIAVELEPDGYAPDRARERVLAIGDTLRTIFDHAPTADGTTPLAAAQELAPALADTRHRRASSSFRHICREA